MTEEDIKRRQQRIADVCENLQKNKKSCFGVRQTSFVWVNGRSVFIPFALNYLSADVLDILPEEQTPQQRADLNTLIERLDRYGLLVGYWQGVDRVTDAAESERRFELALRQWVVDHVPDYCGLAQRPLPQLTAHFKAALQQKIRAYTYQTDLFTWATPILLRALRDLAAAQRPELANLDSGQLQAYVTCILQHIAQNCGIYNLEAEDVVERAVYHIIGTDEATYSTFLQQHGGLWRWAQSVASEETKRAVLHHWIIWLQGEWEFDQAKIKAEMQKRQAVLSAFCSLGSGASHEA